MFEELVRFEAAVKKFVHVFRNYFDLPPANVNALLPAGNNGHPSTSGATNPTRSIAEPTTAAITSHAPPMAPTTREAFTEMHDELDIYQIDQIESDVTILYELITI